MDVSTLIAAARQRLMHQTTQMDIFEHDNFYYYGKKEHAIDRFLLVSPHSDFHNWLQENWVQVNVVAVKS